MKARHLIRGLLSVCVAAALVFSPLSAAAGEMTEETAEPEETTEATVPPGTTESAAEETTEPTTQPSQPPEPEQTPWEVTISYARDLGIGIGDFTVTATVTYHAYGLTVLQDDTGGIAAELPEGISVEPGDRIQVLASRSKTGLAVKSVLPMGTAELPLLVASLSNAESCIRILVRNATFLQGSLTQECPPVPTEPMAPEGIADGQRVNAWGVLARGCFYIEKLEPLEPAMQTLPAVTAIPEDRKLRPGDNIGLNCSVTEAGIFYSLSYDGETYSPYDAYSGGVPVDADAAKVWIRAQARMEGYLPGPVTEFVFTREDLPDGETGEIPEDPQGWNFYFGQLHAHTAVSGEEGTWAEAYDWAANTEKMDFFAVTEYSHSLDNAAQGSINADGAAISQRWAAGKQAAQAATNAQFVGIFGYEMAFADTLYGHINTFNTQGWQCRSQKLFVEAVDYFDVLTTAPGSVSQFNHPGMEYGYFRNFDGYRPQYDPYVQLLEVGTGDVEEVCEMYTRALDKGWHVAPTNNQEGRWGSQAENRESAKGRTVILAQSLTEQSLYSAMADRRVYATEDADLKIHYQLNGAVMGSILQESARQIEVTLSDPTDPIGRVEVIVNGGAVFARREVTGNQQTLTIPVYGDYTYYYLRVIQPDGDIAVTAPVWVDLLQDFGITGLSADKTELTQGEPVNIRLDLYNNEREDFHLESVSFCLEDGAVVYSEPMPQILPALGTWAGDFLFSCSGLGAVELRAVVKGTMAGTAYSFEETLLLQYKSQEPDIPVDTISYVRTGRLGELYRIRGFATTGTSNVYTTFPDQIYVQDSTGGIGISGFRVPDIQIGMPLEISGTLEMEDGNPMLRYVDHCVLEGAYYRYAPQTLYISTAMNTDLYGGQLIQIEGKVQNLTRTADGWGVSWFTLQDVRGDTAAVCVEEAIRSGSSGENRLVNQVKADRTVRAIGILQEENGQPVLRVRDCDEVVYVPPRRDPTNPKTAYGSRIFLPMAVLSASTAGLLTVALFKKRRR